MDAQIRQWERSRPECRLELVDGRILVGGQEEGSRWMLREILTGWTAQAALAMAPLALWEQGLALQPEAWEVAGFAELGSDFTGQHRRVRERLLMDLVRLQGSRHFGHVYYRDLVFRDRDNAYTPDLFVVLHPHLTRMQDRYYDGAPQMVIEVMLPEHQHLDRVERARRYARAGVEHYWIANLQGRAIEFYRLGAGEYRQVRSDPDGVYRGFFEGWTFQPQALWEPRDDLSPLFACPPGDDGWLTRLEEGEDEWCWGRLPFRPRIALEAGTVSFAEFASWCGEAKFEGYGGRYPVVGGFLGTRHLLGMLVAGFGIRQTLSLLERPQWQEAIAAAREQHQASSAIRTRAWSVARQVARDLMAADACEGVGVIGDLVVENEPWHFWSGVTLVLWGESNRSQVDIWRLTGEQPFEVDLVNVRTATPAEWQDITKQMVVLEGSFDPQQHRRKPKTYRTRRQQADSHSRDEA
jgi:Uma2 family endonuclease